MEYPPEVVESLEMLERTRDSLLDKALALGEKAKEYERAIDAITEALTAPPAEPVPEPVPEPESAEDAWTHELFSSLPFATTSAARHLFSYAMARSGPSCVLTPGAYQQWAKRNGDTIPNTTANKRFCKAVDCGLFRRLRQGAYVMDPPSVTVKRCNRIVLGGEESC